MRTGKFTGALLVTGLPILAAVCTSLSLGLLLQELSADATARNLTHWLEILTLAIAATVSGAFCLWWLAGLVYSTVTLTRARAQGLHQVELPAWVPTLIKGATAGMLGISILASPSFATSPTPTPPVTGISQHTELSPLFAQPAESTPSTGETATLSAPDSTHYEAQPQPSFSLAPVTLTLVSGQQETSTTTAEDTPEGTYTALSPLFGTYRDAPSHDSNAVSSGTASSGAASSGAVGSGAVGFGAAGSGANNAAPLEEKARETASPEKQPRGKSPRIYTIASGDTLWGIAESLLPPEASGQQVLALVKDIHASNRAILPTLDTIIYPGQTLTIPIPAER